MAEAQEHYQMLVRILNEEHTEQIEDKRQGLRVDTLAPRLIEEEYHNACRVQDRGNFLDAVRVLLRDESQSNVNVGTLVDFTFYHAPHEFDTEIEALKDRPGLTTSIRKFVYAYTTMRE